MTKSDEIRAILQERYGYCGRIPYGAASDIAAEVGCSRELVRQVALRAEYSTAKQWVVKLCARCEKPVGNGSRSDYCKECQYGTLPCNWCGKPVKRSAWRLAYYVNRGKTNSTPEGRLAGYSGVVYCNRRCFGSWAAHNYGFVAHAENATNWRKK